MHSFYSCRYCNIDVASCSLQGLGCHPNSKSSGQSTAFAIYICTGCCDSALPSPFSISISLAHFSLSLSLFLLEHELISLDSDHRVIIIIAESAFNTMNKTAGSGESGGLEDVAGRWKVRALLV